MYKRQTLSNPSPLRDEFAEDQTPWYLKVAWVMYEIASVASFLVTVLYFALLFNGQYSPCTCTRTDLEKTDRSNRCLREAGKPPFWVSVLIHARISALITLCLCSPCSTRRVFVFGDVLGSSQLSVPCQKSFVLVNNITNNMNDVTTCQRPLTN